MSESVAVVTGASQGIGRASAIRLARDFSAITLVARNLQHLNDTAAKVKAAGAEPLVLDLDLREPASAQTVVSRTLERFDRIDTLLNIAGAVPQIDLFEMTDQQWDDGMALKLHGARRLTLRAWDALKAAGGRVDLGQFCGIPEGPLRRRRHDQCCDCRSGQGIFRSRAERRRSGQQRSSGPGHDRPPPFLSREVGAGAQSQPG